MIGAGNIVHPSTIISVGKAEFSCLFPPQNRAKFHVWKVKDCSQDMWTILCHTSCRKVMFCTHFLHSFSYQIHAVSQMSPTIPGQSYTLQFVERSYVTHIPCIISATKFMQFPRCPLQSLEYAYALSLVFIFVIMNIKND